MCQYGDLETLSSRFTPVIKIEFSMLRPTVSSGRSDLNYPTRLRVSPLLQELSVGALLASVLVPHELFNVPVVVWAFRRAGDLLGRRVFLGLGLVCA